MIDMLNVYENNIKIGYLGGSDADTIARFVAGLEPNGKEYKLTNMFDMLVLSTRGNLLDDVPEQIWLIKWLLPVLVPYQTGEKSFEKVEIIPEEDY